MTTKVERFASNLTRIGDEAWSRYLRIEARVSANTPLLDMEKEITTLHSSRPARRLSLKSNVTPDNLMVASLEEISVRARAVDMLITLSKQRRLLETALTAVAGHIQSNYDDKLISYAGRSKADRQNFLDSLLESGWALYSEMERLEAVIKSVVADIDQTQWMMRNMVELVKITAHHEGVVSTAAI